MFLLPHKSKAIIVVCLFLFCLAPIFCYSQSSLPFTGRVNTEGANLRVDSTVGSPVICKLSKNDKVEVVSELYDWYKVRLPDNAPSYIRRDLVDVSDTGQQKNANLKPGSLESVPYAAVVSKDRINVRLMPTESSAVLGKLDKGEIVKVISTDNNWLRIEPIAKSYGWVHKKFIDTLIVDPAEVKPPVKTKDKKMR